MFVAEAELTLAGDVSGRDKELTLKNRSVCRQLIFIRYPIFYTLSKTKKNKKKNLKTSIKNLNTQDSNTVRSKDFPLH